MAAIGHKNAQPFVSKSQDSCLEIRSSPIYLYNAGSLTTGENKHLHNKANVLQHNIHTYMSD